LEDRKAKKKNIRIKS